MAMSDIPPRSTRRPRARFARRYGSTFNVFDHLANVSLCSQQLGQVEIDCRFRQSKTQWGVLGPAENHAGILYMDLTFAQTKHCRLSSATVWVSLEDPEDFDHLMDAATTPPHHFISVEDVYTQEGGSESGSPSNPNPEEEFNVVRFLQFTQDFGPRNLAGEPTRATTKKTRHLTPEVNVLGNGGGGLGWDREQSIEQTSRWAFTGDLIRGCRLVKNASDIVYRTLKWHLSEDDFQPQATHSNTIQTAFTLEHDEKLFILRIEIQGKLERRNERMKNQVKQLFKFPRDPRENQGVSVTLVNPRAEKTTKRLDAVARGIPFDMERLNLEAVRPQLPITLPVSFQQTSQVPRDDSTSTATAVEEPFTDVSTTDQTMRTRLPDYRPPERISSFPEEAEIIVGRVPTDKLPVKTRKHIVESPARDQFTTARDQIEQSPSRNSVKRRNPEHKETTSKPSNERDAHILRHSRVEEMLASKPVGKPVRISPNIEICDEKPSEDDLNELAAQLAQFPFLLRIMLWVISMMTLTSNKAPRKTLKSE